MHLEHALRNIKTDRANLAHGRLPSMWCAVHSITSRHFAVQRLCPLYAAGSPGRRNTCVKSLGRGFEPQGLARPLIELARHIVQMSLGVHRRSLSKGPSQQTVGVLFGTALPRTLRIAEVNLNVVAGELNLASAPLNHYKSF